MSPRKFPDRGGLEDLFFRVKRTALPQPKPMKHIDLTAAKA